MRAGHRARFPKMPETSAGRLTLAAAAGMALAGAWLATTPLSGPVVSPDRLWAVEPAAFVGNAVLLLFSLLTMAGLAKLRAEPQSGRMESQQLERRWQRLTEEFLQVFEHDLGRPMRRIYGKERELQAVLRASGEQPAQAVRELMEEIERQVPNYRLMLRNVQALVNLEDEDFAPLSVPTDAGAVVEKTAVRYESVARDCGKALTWWTELSAGKRMVNTDPEALEHIVANLVDNAVKHADSGVEISVAVTGGELRVEVSDDGGGILPRHVPHIFEASWTPEVSRREEKTSTGLGLHIARTLARRCGGDVILDSAGGPGPRERTMFVLSVPDHNA